MGFDPCGRVAQGGMDSRAFGGNRDIGQALIEDRRKADAAKPERLQHYLGIGAGNNAIEQMQVESAVQIPGLFREQASAAFNFGQASIDERPYSVVLQPSRPDPLVLCCLNYSSSDFL